MFGMGWAEMLIVGVVALIVIGPKELPVVFRKVGQFAGKAKGMAREFTSAMNAAADQAGVKDAMDDVKSAADGFKNPVRDWTEYKPGSETGKLAKERAENAKKIHDAMAEKAQARLDATNASAEEMERELEEEAAPKRVLTPEEEEDPGMLAEPLAETKPKAKAKTAAKPKAKAAASKAGASKAGKAKDGEAKDAKPKAAQSKATKAKTTKAKAAPKTPRKRKTTPKADDKE